MPNRSASRITITVALGTSTPTSITVVATSTSSSPARKRSIVASFSADGIRPWSSPSRRPRQLAGGQPLERLLGRRHLELLALLDERAHDVRLTAGRHLGAHVGPRRGLHRADRSAHCVSIGVRPGGSSSSTLTSRSPYTVIAAVRGIGVAVITSMSGTAPSAVFARSAARCSTPNRCCSSTTTTPRLANSTASWIRACVPMAMSTVPSARPASTLRRSRAGDPVRQQLDPQRPVAEQVAGVGDAQTPASSARTLAACCSASTSVGAISAAWWPPCTAASIAATATTVLPDADVALQQPVHRVRCGEIGLDLARSPAAGRRVSVVRQAPRRTVGPAHRRRAWTRPRCVALELALAHHEDELHPQEFVERQPASRRLLVAHRCRAGGSRGSAVAAIDEPEPRANRRRHRLGDATIGAAPQRLLDPSGDLPRAELRLLALRVDRHDAAGPVADQVDDRVRHLQPTAVGVGLAEQRDLQALAELLLPPRLVEEHHLHPTRPVADLHVDHRAAIPRGPLGDRPHRDQHQRLLSRARGRRCAPRSSGPPTVAGRW